MFLCEKCTTRDRVIEFPTLAALAEHTKGGHKLPPEKRKKESSDFMQRVDPPVKKEIKLVYKYEGNCDKCGKEVETLTFNIGKEKSFWAVAFCTTCRAKLAERKVVPL